MSWLSQFVKHNRDFAGNLLKNAAPAAFLIPGIGPGAAALLGGAGSALGRGIQHGANLGNIVKQGATGAAIAYGGGQGLNALKGAFTPSSSVSGALPGVQTTPGAVASAAGSIQGPGEAALNLTQGLGQAPSLASRVGSAISGAGKFAQANPMAVSAGLQGLGQIGTMGADNAYKRAQTNAVNQQTAMSQAELDVMRRRQAALEPLMRALMGQQQGVATNPYTPTAGH